ncbi:RNA polymerase sigma factor [Amycolatopsis sp. NPDC003865]
MTRIVERLDRPDLAAIATNLLRNHLRQEVRGFQLTAKAGAEERPEENHDTAVAGRVDAAARLRVLARELAALSEQDRDILLLTSWAGLEPAEVAEALGVPAGTVRSRLHRVRHRLQALLVPTEENPPCVSSTKPSSCSTATPARHPPT